ncbi:MAG: Gfo/Idh/MocA family oxidoreductase [Tepidisphaeraceae bacterium]
MSHRIKIGIVGFGRIGAEHAAWVGASSGLRVGAVFDPTPERSALAASRGLRTAESMDALLSDDSIDAVLVSTPTSMHYDPALAALQAGKHVMVEKPMTLVAKHAAELIRVATEQKRTLSVFHCRRWDVDFLTVLQLVKSGALGRVFSIESRLSQWASCVGPAAREFRPEWRNEARFGGGGLYDWGSHFIDQLWRLHWPAKPARVFAQLRGNVWTRDCDDLARVCIDFDDGTVGLCEINTTTTRPLPRWHLDGTLGSADSPHSLTFDTREWAKLRLALADGTQRDLPLAPVGLNETAIWEQFARSCRGEGPPAVLAQTAYQTMVLLDAARESWRDGTVVPVATGNWVIE